MTGPDLDGWSPGPVETHGVIDPWPARAFAGLLDVPSPGGSVGDPLPPLWHGFHLLAHPAQSELGEDGHPAAGRFLPPLPDRRRMFAGGRLEMREPLRTGDAVTRRSSLAAVAPKTGRSGVMVFVTERHEWARDGRVAVVEEQDFAYRSQSAGSVRNLTPTPGGGGEPDRVDGWSLRLDTDTAVLFRFSALTYNTHRIHYDVPYATGVEGYPGLVVHGPLLALLLLELPRRFAPDRTVTAFSYRLRAPVFAGSPVVASGRPDALVAGTPGAAPAITGSVTLT